MLNLGSRNPGGKIFGNYSVHCCCCSSDVISHDHYIVCQYPVSLRYLFQPQAGTKVIFWNAFIRDLSKQICCTIDGTKNSIL